MNKARLYPTVYCEDHERRFPPSAEPPAKRPRHSVEEEGGEEEDVEEEELGGGDAVVDDHDGSDADGEAFFDRDSDLSASDDDERELAAASDADDEEDDEGQEGDEGEGDGEGDEKGNEDAVSDDDDFMMDEEEPNPSISWDDAVQRGLISPDLRELRRPELVWEAPVYPDTPKGKEEKRVAAQVWKTVLNQISHRESAASAIRALQAYKENSDFHHILLEDAIPKTYKSCLKMVGISLKDITPYEIQLCGRCGKHPFLVPDEIKCPLCLTPKKHKKYPTTPFFYYPLGRRLCKIMNNEFLSSQVPDAIRKARDKFGTVVRAHLRGL